MLPPAKLGVGTPKLVLYPTPMLALEKTEDTEEVVGVVEEETDVCGEFFPNRRFSLLNIS